MYVQSLSGAGTDTLDVVIQESDEEDFATASRIRTLGSFTPVLGNSTSSVLLSQSINTTVNTTNRFLRAKLTIAGTASVFSQKVTVILLADERV